MPFFSIIIPVYNVAPYLRECLDSVLAQTFTDWEAICVDDGSTDGSGAILDKYAACDPRFRIVHKNNEGVSIARNVAMDVASGKYITFVDSDDVVLSDWLRVYRDVIATDGCDVVRANFKHWHGNSAYRTESKTHYKVVGRYTTRKDICAVCVPEALNRGYSVINCIRRAILSGVRFPIGICVLEDCIFNAHAMSKANSVSVIDYAGYLYRMREGSAVHSHINSHMIVLDRYNFLNALVKFWRDCCLSEIESAYLPPIRAAITKFVFEHIQMLIASTKRSLIRPDIDYRRLVDPLRELCALGAFDMKALAWSECIAFVIYIRTFRWCIILLIWKLRAGRYKLSKLLFGNGESDDHIKM